MQQASTWEESQLNDKVKCVQFEELEDIIKMMSASMRAPPLHHKEVKDGHIYFLPASLALGKEIIYFVKVKEKVERNTSYWTVFTTRFPLATS